MNLFVTSLSPTLAAQSLDNKRLNKMILETAQLLCTELSRRGYPMPYKPTHQSHPVTLSLQHDPTLLWAGVYFEALHTEYVYRFLKTHASYTTCASDFRARLPFNVPGSPIFANCARNQMHALDFTHHPVPESYQHYLSARWNRESPLWTGRKAPDWHLRRVKILENAS